jgi:hypothetical protein
VAPGGALLPATPHTRSHSLGTGLEKLSTQAPQGSAALLAQPIASMTWIRSRGAEQSRAKHSSRRTQRTGLAMYNKYPSKPTTIQKKRRVIFQTLTSAVKPYWMPQYPLGSPVSKMSPGLHQPRAEDEHGRKRSCSADTAPSSPSTGMKIPGHLPRIIVGPLLRPVLSFSVLLLLLLTLTLHSLSRSYSCSCSTHAPAAFILSALAPASMYTRRHVQVTPCISSTRLTFTHLNFTYPS